MSKDMELQHSLVSANIRFTWPITLNFAKNQGGACIRATFGWQVYHVSLRWHPPHEDVANFTTYTWSNPLGRGESTTLGG